MAVFIISYVPGRSSAPPAKDPGAGRGAERAAADGTRSEPTIAVASGAAAMARATLRREVTDAARVGGMAYLEGVRRGWGKRELASWLLGPYARATAFAPRGDRVPRMSADACAEPLDEDVVVDLLLAVRAQVTATLDMMVRSKVRPWFVDQAIERGHVLPSVDDADDDDARALWLPRDRPTMRLGDRVLSLFAADYLARPTSYEQTLYICSCESVTFDVDAEMRGMCKQHDRASGVIPSNTLLGSENVAQDFADFDDEVETEPRPFLLKRKAAIPY